MTVLWGFRQVLRQVYLSKKFLGVMDGGRRGRRGENGKNTESRSLAPAPR